MQPESISSTFNTIGNALDNYLVQPTYHCGGVVFGSIGEILSPLGINTMSVITHVNQSIRTSFFRASEQKQIENITSNFIVTTTMLPALATLGMDLTLNQTLTLDDVKHHYKQKARKLHPDRNKSTNAHAEFLELQSAYDTLKTLIQRQLDPLGLSAELTAYFNALDEELNELQQGYKDLGQTITRYNQNADQFIQGVNALNQQTEEVLQLASEYNNNVQRYNERADQYIAKAEQYIARVTQNSILVQENGEQLKALTAGFGECNDQLQANQQSISELNAELSQLLQARRLAANSQQATNPHRLMKPPTITPVNKDETLGPTNANR